jgi:hypothetical protein
VNVLFLAKVFVSALVIAAAVEAAKRDPYWGAVIVALPLTSVLAMSWLYLDTRDNALLRRFARDVFVIVPVSLVFFLPFLLEARTRLGFVSNILIGLGLLAGSVWVLRRILS